MYTNLFDQNKLDFAEKAAKVEIYSEKQLKRKALYSENNFDDFFEIIQGLFRDVENIDSNEMTVDLENLNFNRILKGLSDGNLIFRMGEILGEYKTNEESIYYYDINSQNPLKLKVVEIHERFHAVHHLTPDTNGNSWDDFVKVDNFYLELLAQLFTYIYITQYKNQSLLYEFETLNQNQSFIYKTYKIFKHFNQQQAEKLYWIIRNNEKSNPIFTALYLLCKEIKNIKQRYKTVSKFNRSLDPMLIKQLKAPKNSSLFNQLNKDIKEGKVFTAIRNNYIDFYYKGGRLFQFDKNGFKTNIKYAAVIAKGKTDYLTEKQLSNTKLAANFSTNYIRIKENCANYAGLEAIGVSDIYNKFSYIFPVHDIVVLDIEVTFVNEGMTQNRIDILLYSKKEKQLRFVEAKHFPNKEIWTKTPYNAINQIKLYEKQVKKNKKAILNAYKYYIDAVNKLFNLSLPDPQSVSTNIILFIFGFDKDQNNNSIKLLKTSTKYKGIYLYTKGNTSGAFKIDRLWDAKKL